MLCRDLGGLYTNLPGLVLVLVLGWVDSEKWPDTTEGLLKRSEFSFFLNPGQSLWVISTYCPGPCLQLSLQDMWFF